MGKSKVSNINFIEHADAMGAELAAADALCNVICSNFEGRGDMGQFKLRPDFINGAVEDVCQKLDRMRVAYDGMTEAWRLTHSNET